MLHKRQATPADCSSLITTWLPPEYKASTVYAIPGPCTESVEAYQTAAFPTRTQQALARAASTSGAGEANGLSSHDREELCLGLGLGLGIPFLFLCCFLARLAIWRKKKGGVQKGNGLGAGANHGAQGNQAGDNDGAPGPAAPAGGAAHHGG